MSKIIIPPVECTENGCTEQDKCTERCSGCENKFIPWFVAGVDLSSQPDQPAYIEPEPPTQPMEQVIADKLEKAERLKRFLPYIKWLLITAAGVALCFWAAELAYIERGYKAYGGECFFLLLPLFWYLIGATAKDSVATVKEILKEDKQND